MRCICYDRFGTVAELHESEIAEPSLGPRSVLVEVMATSINVIDYRVRNGSLVPLVNKRFPKIPGADFAGVVKAVGKRVRSLKPGDLVYGATDPFKGGTFAEFVLVPEDQVARKPPTLSFEEAASVPVTSLAALISLRDLGQSKRGDELLIHGASGAFGLAALQLASKFGVEVTAVVSPSGVELGRSLGAKRIIDYKNEDASSFDRQFDIIINASGKFPFDRAKKFLKPQGRFIEPSPTIPIFIGSKLANLFRSRKHLMLQTMARRRDLDLPLGFVHPNNFI